MEKKIYYVKWDSKNPELMKEALSELGATESIIEEIFELDLMDDTIVIPKENGYSTYYGYNNEFENNTKFEEYTIENLPIESCECNPTPGECDGCEVYENMKKDGKFNKKSELVTTATPEETNNGCEESEDIIIDLDKFAEVFDEFEVTKTEDEAKDIYSHHNDEIEIALDMFRTLLRVRDEYREVEYEVVAEMKGLDDVPYLDTEYSILSDGDGGFEVVRTEYPSVFSFASKHVANKFLENFEETLRSFSDIVGYIM